MVIILSVFIIINLVSASQPYWNPTDDTIAIIMAGFWNLIGILISLIVQVVTLIR